ncbi:hypothetical protein ACFSQ7_09000 [Paenibacillus rhizoplanae]
MKNDFILYNDIRNEIRNMQSFDTRLEDVILLNQRQNWMIKNSGLYRLNEYRNYEQLTNLLNVEGSSSWVLNPSSLFYSEESINVTGCKYSISLIKKLPTTKLQKYGLALANIPACSLQDFINPDMQPLDSIMVLDKKRTDSAASGPQSDRRACRSGRIHGLRADRRCRRAIGTIQDQA